MKTLLNLMFVLSGFAVLTSAGIYFTSKESLLAEEDERAAGIFENNFASTLFEIDRNLEIIKEREGLITLGPGSNVEEGLSYKEKILRNIQLINALLDRNRMKIDQLENALSDSEFENDELQLLAGNAREKLEQKEKSIFALKLKLEDLQFTNIALNTTLSDLEVETELLHKMIDQLKIELNQVYYISGSTKHLKEQGIIEKNGGILGLASAKSINEDVNIKHFYPADARKLQTITLNCDKAKIISKHPESSYELQKSEKGQYLLTIKNPEVFWKFSKYLVISTDDKKIFKNK